MTAPLRQKPSSDEMVVVRVPMSRAIYRRLLAECILLDREPGALTRDILVAAFNSGDLTELRDISPPVSEACSNSVPVASASHPLPTHEEK